MTRTTDIKLTRTLKNTLKNIAAPDSSQIYWLLRSFCVGRQDGGFILPTVTLLLLMVSLIIGLLISRTYSRTTQVAGDRQQTVLYNAVTPAVDRAKAKIEYLFTQAALPPLPSDTDLNGELQKAAYDLPIQTNASPERRIDINGDGTPDNAWLYTADLDSDGDTETIAYSILSNSSATVSTTTYTLESVSNTNKARALVVRNGPINLSSSAGGSCANLQKSPYAGWEAVNSSELRKAIQVHAIVLDSNINAISATLEMQQDRVANLGNRWGAWFRYDLELNPSTRFNFNGALHTEGNFIWSNTGTPAVLHLVSSPKSCVYSKSASEISMASIAKYNSAVDSDLDGFQGQVFLGDMLSSSQGDDSSSAGILVDRYRPAPSGPSIPNTGDNQTGDDRVRIVATTSSPSATKIRDSVNGSSSKNEPAEIALNPVVLQTLGISEARVDDESNRAGRASSEWIEGTTPAVGNSDGGRIFNESTSVPFLDDTYRADNRLGPGVGYGRANSNTFCGKTYCLGETALSALGAIGSLGSNTATSDLVQLDPMANIAPLNEDGYGLDGYWERRARRSGVRVIVGQRLELGNVTEWFNEDLNNNGALNTALSEATDAKDYNGDGDTLDTVSEDKNGNNFLDVDSLYPPRANAYVGTNMADRAHEMRQMKTLRDNLAAAQATAVYHYKNNYDYPVACLATTAHPGTEITDRNSRTFNFVTTSTTNPTKELLTDFYSGTGTNGIEFKPPFADEANPETAFQNAINTSDSALRIALTNLAYFAGDPYGAFPAIQDSNDGTNNELHASSGGVSSTVGAVTHPYSSLTMWGNYSELRRVINRLESGITYANLSIADKTTLHTATCTIGMLAYSTKVKIDNFKLDGSTGTTPPTTSGNLVAFMENVSQLIDGQNTAGNGEIYALASPDDTATSIAATGCAAATRRYGQAGVPALAVALPSGYLGSASATALKDFLGQFTLAQWICAVSRDSGKFSGDATTVSAIFNEINNNINGYIAELSLFQLDRDRALGFSEGSYSRTTSSFSGTTINWDPATGQVSYGSGANANTLTVGCHPQIIKNLLTGSGTGLDDKSIATALSICGTSITSNIKQTIQYPALYYLFPLASHAHDGEFISNTVRTAAAALTPALPEKQQSLLANTVYDNLYTKDPYIYSSTYKSGTGTGVNYYQDNAEGTTRFYYRPVEDGQGIGNRDGLVSGNSETMAAIVNYLDIAPRDRTNISATPSNWDTPITTTATNRVNTIRFDSTGTAATSTTPTYTNWYPAFLDVGMYSGRENMSIRSLNIDLDLLRRYRFERDTGLATANCIYTSPTDNTEKTADNNGECWLPLPTLLENSGGSTSSGAIIYAFREDAVREDAIARPTRTGASNLTCDTDTTVGTADDDKWLEVWRTYINATDTSQSNGNTAWGNTYETNASGLDTADLLMNAVGNTGANGQDPGGQYYDPPVNPCTKISPKPVDFYADPDRRAHGFTLRNGADLRRMNGTTAEKDGRGMTFVSDNPVYVQGDFNLHSTDGTTGTSNANLVEEFITKLASNWSNFYTRSDLNPDFADAKDTSGTANVVDSWRPTEIIADGVTVLSADFTPGYIAQGLLWSTDASTPQNSYGGMTIMRTNRRPGSSQNDKEQADANGTGTLRRWRWLLEDGTTVAKNQNQILGDSNYFSDLALLTSPVEIDRNGFPLYYSGGTQANFYSNGTLTSYGASTSRNTEHFEALTYDGNGDDSNGGTSPVVNTSDTDGTQNISRTRSGRIQAPTGTTIVNALVIGGTNPTRAVHSSGGLAGMLRTMQKADGSTLQFAGSLIQLNFNAYAAPFHHGAWEPGTMGWAATGSGGFSYFSYFSAPTRNWGFDPGLLYAPASPAARRLAVPANTRSEFYREVATDDPYILNLRCAFYDSNGNGTIQTNGTDSRIDPKATCQ